MRKFKAVFLRSVCKCKTSADCSYLLDVLCVAIRFVYCIVHTCAGATDVNTCSVSAKGVTQAVQYV
jgi:hypothetical protein